MERTVRYIKGLIVAVLLLVGRPLLVAEPAAKADFYVAANGNDNHPGTEAQPFATLKRARDAVRRKIAAGLRADVTVLIRGGTYELNEPLTFGPKDSGTQKHAITYAADSNEKVVVSGGRKITGWQQGEGNLWTVELPDVKAGKWSFRQLFVNDQRATRARTPNVDDSISHWTISSATLESLSFSSQQPQNWQNLRDVEVVVFGDWEITRKNLQSVDAASRTVTLLSPHLASHPRLSPNPGRACYFENAREMLDRPGEWYLDRSTGVLSYLPLPEQDVTRAEVVAPALTRLLEVKGTASQPVRNVHFKSIRFSHTGGQLPAEGYYGCQACFFTKTSWVFQDLFRMEEAIRWEFAESCSLRDGQIAHVGGVGLSLRKGCVNNVVEGNEIVDVSASGINVGEDVTPHHLRNEPSLPTGEPQDNRIANNHVHACGVEFHGGVGIWVGLTDGTIVSHNVLHNLPYTGISVGWRWDASPTTCKNNRIEFNHVYDVMKLLCDGGGIYTLGLQPGTVLRGNLIHDVRRSSVALGSENNGIFIDEGSKDFLVEGNMVYSTSGEPLRFHQSQRDWHSWGNNSFGVKPESPEFPKAAAAKAGLEPLYRKLLEKR